MVRNVVVLATHPIQYQVPIWRGLHRNSGVNLRVFYFSDHSIEGGIDPGFGVRVTWDVPLLDGYQWEFISRSADLSKPRSVGFRDFGTIYSVHRPEWIYIQGYTHRFERQAIVAAKRHGLKVIMRGEFTDHGYRRHWIRRFSRRVYLRWFYSQVDSFCYIGEAARQHLLSFYVNPERMFFSPYCVDDEFFGAQRTLFERGECRAQLGLDNGDFAVLFSGKLISRKQPELLIEAMSQFARQGRTKLLMVGDGPLRERVHSLGHRLLGSAFRPCGFVNQSQLGRYFAAADAFVLPSAYESWGLVVNEAMIFGLPVVVSDQVGCHRDLVTEGETGFVFRAGNVGELMGALTKLMRDGDGSRRIGANAARRAEKYSVAASVEGIIRGLRER